MTRSHLLLVGASRAGLGAGAALARAAGLGLRVWNRGARAHAELRGEAGLRRGLAEARAVLVAVRDDALAEMAGRIAEAVAPGEEGPGLVFHLSGACGLEALESLRATPGTRRGALHPLRTFAAAEPDPEALRGVTCVTEGEDDEVIATLHAWCRAAGGVPARLEAGQRARYHAAAVLASNALVALVAEALAQMRRAGLEEEVALPGLLRLAFGALEDVAARGPAQALTGPLVRGDREVLRRHLEVHGGDETAARVYRILARSTLELAESSGRLDAAAAEELRRTLDGDRGPARDDRAGG